MEENTNARRTKAWIGVDDPALRESLSDLSRLALLSPVLITEVAPRLEEVVKTDIALVESQWDIPPCLEKLHRVRVCGASSFQGDETADIRLPGDEVALLQLLSSMSEVDADDQADKERVLLVAAWNGGGGATTAARKLSAISGAVLLDAAGNRGSQMPLEEGILWDGLHVDDLPADHRLVAGLPRIDGVPTLTAGPASPVRPSDSKVLAVATRTSRTVIIDCGIFIDEADELKSALETMGKSVVSLLIGNGHQVGAAALGRWHAAGLGPDVKHLVSDRPQPVFHTVVDRYGLRWSRAPRVMSRRGWKKTEARLWR